MAVVARVVGLLFKTAMGTTIDVPAQITGTAGNNIVKVPAFGRYRGLARLSFALGRILTHRLLQGFVFC